MGEPKEHFDLEPANTEAPSPVEPPKPPSPPAPAAPSSPADAPSLLELAEDKCPKCGTVLRHDAVFCIKCGYDMRTNEVRKPTLGVEHVVEKPKEEPKEFSVAGRGNLQLLLGIGAAITIGAMVVAGLNAPPGFRIVAAVLLCLYEIVLHTGTGMVAVFIACRIAELKPGNIELAAARMLVAFSTFQLIRSISFGTYPTLLLLLMYPLALAAYWGLIMLLFRKPRMLATTVLVAHAVLWIAVQAGMELSSYVRSAPAVVTTTAPPPAPTE